MPESRRGDFGDQRVQHVQQFAPGECALAGIRFLARVFTVVFPESGLARLVERLFSWLAWIAAVLWIVGLLLATMAGVHLFFERTVMGKAMKAGPQSAGSSITATAWGSPASRTSSPTRGSISWTPSRRWRTRGSFR